MLLARATTYVALLHLPNNCRVLNVACPRKQPFRTARIPSRSGLFSIRVILVREPNEGGQIAF
jgi:hypothetical protein